MRITHHIIHDVDRDGWGARRNQDVEGCAHRHVDISLVVDSPLRFHLIIPYHDVTIIGGAGHSTGIVVLSDKHNSIGIAVCDLQ